MSNLTEIINIIVNGTIEIIKLHGFVIGILAVIGLFCIISTVFSKLFQGVKIIFTLFIALPLIALIGIFNMKNKQQRKKELGEIRAFVKDNPDRLKKLIYGILITIFFIIIGIAILWLILTFFKPLLDFNEASKELLKNFTLNNINISK